MSYQVLARKWRPSTFTEMVGQEHVLQALVNALDSGRLHHAYLFTGTRGVGKTSIARLFAKALNCEQGVSSTPCGTCAACVSISEGRFVDLIEVDAASRTKVEDTRELLENVQYAPTQGRFKVYLIDEVHMLSTNSFNALLKTLEEPPPHVKFLLATTDPQKLPVTILSRCLQFNLKNMTPERIVSHLQNILQAETVNYADQALWLLARAANGSMRDALSLTDQAIAFGSGELLEADVRSMLGSVDHQQVLQLINALASADAAAVMAQVEQISAFGVDFDDVLAELITLLHRVAIAQLLPDSVDNSLGDREEILALAQGLAAEDVQLFYQIALHGRKDLPLVPVPRDGFEMTLLRMLAFRPVQAGEMAVPSMHKATAETGSDAAASETTVTEASAPETKAPEANIAAEVPESAPVTAAEMTAPSATQPKPVFSPPTPMSAPEPQSQQQEPAVSDDPPPWATEQIDQGAAEPPKKPEAPAPETHSATWGEAEQSQPEVPIAQARPDDVSEPDASALDAVVVDRDGMANTVAEDGDSSVSIKNAAELNYQLEELNAQQWLTVFELIGLSGMTYNIAANAVVEGVQAGRVELSLPSNQYHLINDTHIDRVQQAFSNFYSQPVQVEFVERDSSQMTPAAHREEQRQQRLAAAVESINTDPHVQAIVTQFEGTVELSSVTPIDVSE